MDTYFAEINFITTGTLVLYIYFPLKLGIQAQSLQVHRIGKLTLIESRMSDAHNWLRHFV